MKTKLGRLVWEEGMETSQEAWAGILRAEHCSTPGSRVGKEGKGCAGKNQGGLRRGEEGENKRICASTLPPPSLAFSPLLGLLPIPTTEKS